MTFLLFLVSFLNAVLENIIVDQICDQDDAIAFLPKLPPVEFQPQPPEFRISEAPEERGQVICCDLPQISSIHASVKTPLSVQLLEFLVARVKVSSSAPQPELPVESRTAPARTDTRQDDRERQVTPEVFESPAGGELPDPWLISTTGVQTPAHWLHEGATPPPPPPPAALTDPTTAGEGSADSTVPSADLQPHLSHCANINWLMSHPLARRSYNCSWNITTLYVNSL